MTHPIPAHLRAAVAFAEAGHEVSNALAVRMGGTGRFDALLYEEDVSLVRVRQWHDEPGSTERVRYDAIPTPTPDEHPALAVLRAVFSETTP